MGPIAVELTSKCAPPRSALVSSEMPVIFGVNRSPFLGVASHHGWEISRPTYHSLHLYEESGSTVRGRPSTFIDGMTIEARLRLKRARLILAESPTASASRSATASSS